MTRAPGKRTADSAATASAILGSIEAGATYAQAARDAGVTPARARQIAKEAGLPPRTPGGLRSEAVTTRTARGAAILARVVDLAAAAGEEPIDWIEDAARCVKACEEIVYILEGLPRNDGASPWTCEQLLKLAIGHNPPDLAAKVRAAVDAATEDA